MKQFGFKRKSFLFASAAMLVATAVALTTITYAWFTVSKDGIVDTIQFQATSVAGMQISTEDGPWGRVITADDLGISLGTSGKLDPVSTVNTATNGDLKFYKASIAEGLATVSEASKAGSGANGYYAFDIYVRAYGEDAQNLFLDSTKTLVKNIKPDGAGGFVDSDDTYTGYAARVAILCQGSASNKDQAKTLKNGTNAVIYEPYSKDHTVDAIANYGATPTKLNYKGVRGAKSNVALNNNLIDDSSITSDVTTSDFTTNASTISLCSLPSETVTKLRVYIWLEGQDVDCSASIAAGYISTALQFAVN